MVNHVGNSVNLHSVICISKSRDFLGGFCTEPSFLIPRQSKPAAKSTQLQLEAKSLQGLPHSPGPEKPPYLEETTDFRELLLGPQKTEG